MQIVLSEHIVEVYNRRSDGFLEMGRHNDKLLNRFSVTDCMQTIGDYVNVRKKGMEVVLTV